jgi:hypothetical protein
LGTSLSAKFDFATAGYTAGFDARPGMRGKAGSGTSREHPFPNGIWEREENMALKNEQKSKALFIWV